MGKIDFDSGADCRQDSVNGIEQDICGEVPHRFEPFPFKDVSKISVILIRCEI